MNLEKAFKWLCGVLVCIVIILLIPFFSSNTQSKIPQFENCFESSKQPTKNYDGVYSDVNYIGDGYRYKSCEGTFKNLTGRKINNLGVQISFFDGNSKLQTSLDSIGELGANENWKFKIDYVDKNAVTVRFDKFTENISFVGVSELNVISEEKFIEKKNYKKPTAEELAAQHKEWERQTALQKQEIKIIENQNQNETNKIESKKINKSQKLLEGKYRGVRLRAESGGVEAMFELSEMLRNGIGCETNIDESNQWLNKFNQKKQSETK